MSVLYPATLLNLFTSASSWYVVSLGCYPYSTMLPPYHDCHTSLLPIWMPFITVSCLIVDLVQILVGRLSALHYWVLCWWWAQPESREASGALSPLTCLVPCGCWGRRNWKTSSAWRSAEKQFQLLLPKAQKYSPLSDTDVPLPAYFFCLASYLSFLHTSS